MSRICKACDVPKELDQFPVKKKVGDKVYRGPICVRCVHLDRRYGISAAEYDLLFEAQGGKCAICGAVDSGRDGQPLFVDHDHGTGVIRGLLCWPCNRGIGFLGDSANGVRRALIYLEKS